ncbi:hypothetical protein CPB83DRAFT_854640 [Crepidotus variabilis]|uniref:Uncharacterized protein n=1 Tax=Crepidotus variabilis TaxID=179855 RepID=A0A9P6EFZ9_9AGAR|nr:hypothetical protein CPB83DRAFT_854640 [Crepidotus variabilis]
MRCHSSLSLLLTDPFSQRSRPTCKLSLANVSASTSLEPNAMEVDLPSLAVSVPSSNVWEETQGVPFPSASSSPPRKHALFQPTSTVLGDRSNRSTFEDHHTPPSPTEATPPRKRSRTAALLPMPKLSRTHRFSSLPPRGVSSRTPKSASSLLSSSASPSARSLPQVMPNPCEQFTYTFPTMSTTTMTAATRSTNSQLPSITDLIQSTSTITAQRPVPPPPTQTPAPPALRRRKPNSSEMKILGSLYRTLVLGLANKHTQLASRQDPSGTPYEDRPTTMAQLAIQDAVLADRLRWYLTANGGDVSLSRDADQDAMETENEDPNQSTDAVSASPLLPPGISTMGCITSYQQMVSSLLIRRRSEARSVKAAKKSGDRRRTRSKLFESIAFS